MYHKSELVVQLIINLICDSLILIPRDWVSEQELKLTHMWEFYVRLQKVYVHLVNVACWILC